MASAAFEEIFLPSLASPLRTQRPAEDVQGNLAKKRVILSKARVLMSVAAEFRDRPNPLEDVLRKVRVFCKVDRSDELILSGF